MRKSNLFFYSLLILAVGCHQKKATRLISKWDIEHPSVNRNMAAGPSGQCMKDNFSVELLKQEVIDIEQKFSNSEKVQGQWKHIDLSTLPVPQANFLLAYGDKIGDLKNPDAIDYSTCTDVPCIFNRIYEKENYVAGYVHYLWYLKLGHMLSADNKTPDQKSLEPGSYGGKTYPLSDYLFSKNELYGLWRTTHFLQSDLKSLRQLREVQRIPKGSLIEDFPGGVCGLANSGGNIVLNDGCLTTGWDGDIDRGHLYNAVLHELFHMLDYQQALSGQWHRSHRPDYLEVAGWSIEEYNEAGITQRRWKLAKKTVTAYAGTNPQENFAESLAWFRLDADMAKKNMDEDHYVFISNQYFGKKFFEKSIAIKNWIEDLSIEIDQSVLKAAADCHLKTGVETSEYFNLDDFLIPIMPSVMKCYGLKAEEISSSLVSKISLVNPEGCNVFADKTLMTLWNTELKAVLAKSFDKSYVGIQKDKNYFDEAKKYYSILTNRTIARDAYIDCYSKNEVVNCYRGQIIQKIHDKILEVDISNADKDEMVKLYLSSNPIETTKGSVHKSYQDLVNSNLSLITGEAKNTWRACVANPQDDLESPKGTHFIIDKGYMISSLYNCLNLQIPEAIKRSVRHLKVDSEGVQDAQEELIFFTEVKPYVLNVIRDQYEFEKDKEFKAATEFAKSGMGRYRQELLSDFAWAKNSSSQSSILLNCTERTLKTIEFKPYYHLMGDLFRSYIEKNVCLNIESEPQFKGWFETNIISITEEKILSSVKERASHCIKQYPLDTKVNKIRFRAEREACLISQWENIEEQVIKQVLRESTTGSGVTRESLKQKIELNRRRLQIKVIRDHFE